LRERRRIRKKKNLLKIIKTKRERKTKEGKNNKQINRKKERMERERIIKTGRNR
jgi:hypothetical protein